ncbi:MAG: HEAT repeat domain-containing protein [Candidatus Thorarchaeota archaeon]
MGVSRGELALSIMMRDYVRVERLVDMKTQEIGWTKTAKHLARLRNCETVPGNSLFPIRKGTFRDSMIRVLGLESISGIDTDLLIGFREINASNLNELRREIMELSLDILRNQIRQRNTFFLDTDAMSTSPYAILVADLLESRCAEISDLASKPSLWEVFSTYYGFVVITAGSVENGFAGASKEAIEGIENLSQQFGDQVKIPARLIKQSKAAFSNCSHYTKKLLWSLLRVAASGYDKRSTAVRELGNLGDERALTLLHSRLESNSGWVMPPLIEAVGKIGDPSSLELLRKLLDGRYTKKNAILALGGIRHPSVLSHIKSAMDSERHLETPGIMALGESRHPDAVPILLKILRTKRGRKRVHAMYSLLNIGKEGIEVLKTNRNFISGAIRSSGVPGRAIEIAQALPNFQWGTAEIEAIAKVITKRTHMKGLAEVLRELPEVLSDVRIVGAIIRVYRDAYSQETTRSSQSYSYYSYRSRRKSMRALRKVRELERARVIDAIAQSILLAEGSIQSARMIASCEHLMKYSTLRDAVMQVLNKGKPCILTAFESWFR